MKTRAQRKLERNKERLARQFHSPQRIEWIRSLPCEMTGVRGGIHNAHMKSRGAGGTWHDIVPLNHQVHNDFDTMSEEKFYIKYKRTKSSIRNTSWFYVRLWQMYLEKEQISVCHTIDDPDKVP
tara:strand:- start:3257 stop:3628 length:372 start_codon:yes stop_codon:yes gene_type:complete